MSLVKIGSSCIEGYTCLTLNVNWDVLSSGVVVGGCIEACEQVQRLGMREEDDQNEELTILIREY